MFIKNSVKLAVVAVSVMSAASAVVAQETISSTATVTISNAFTLAEVTPLTFGSFRLSASSGSTDTATIEVANDGTTEVTATGNTSGTVLTDGTLGEYTISGAAPFTNLVLANDGTNVELDSSNGTSVALNTPSDNGTDFVMTIPLTKTLVVGGANDGATITTSGNVQTDTTGAVGFRIGGELAYDPASATNETPADGVYTGSYTLTVSY